MSETADDVLARIEGRRQDALLRDLWAQLCAPVLEAAGRTLTEPQARAVACASLFLVATAPARVQLLGFADGPVDCGAFDLPAAGGDALARFLSVGLATLPDEDRQSVAAVVSAGHGQLTAVLRPDQGRAECFLVARGDRVPPIRLFQLQAAPEVAH